MQRRASTQKNHRTEVVNALQKGMRLDQWLSAITGLSRSQAQKLIRGGFVFIKNEQSVKPGAILKEHSSVAWTLPKPEQVEQAPPLDVVFEDESLLVINKPAGVVVHPGSGVTSATLLESIRAHLGTVSWDERGGLVHRLDKDTSGLLLIAKGPEVLNALQKQWHERTVTKKYIALLIGELKPNEGSIDAPIGRHMKDRRKMRVDAAGKTAVTQYTVTKKFSGFTLVLLQPITGRTHQIRVHLAAIGFPIAGDETYGDRDANVPLRAKGLSRQFLHASELSFIHPGTGKSVTFHSALPNDLESVLDVLE